MSKSVNGHGMGKREIRAATWIPRTASASCHPTGRHGDEVLGYLTSDMGPADAESHTQYFKMGERRLSEQPGLEQVQQSQTGTSGGGGRLPDPLSARLQAQAGWRERGHGGAIRGLLRQGRRQRSDQLGGRRRGLHGGWRTGGLPASRRASSSHPGSVHDPHAHAGEGHKNTCLPTRDRAGATPRPYEADTFKHVRLGEQQHSLSPLLAWAARPPAAPSIPPP